MVGFVLTWFVVMLSALPLSLPILVLEGPVGAIRYLIWAHRTAMVAHPSRRRR